MTSIPEFIYLLPMEDEPILWSCDEDDFGANNSGLRGNESCSTSNIKWFRWDTADGAICDAAPRSHKSNFQWEAPRPVVKGVICLQSEVNVSIDVPGDEHSHQKLLGSLPEPLFAKARSLSPDRPFKSKLKNCPPRLPREPPRRVRGPPKPPVRKMSRASPSCPQTIHPNLGRSHSLKRPVRKMSRASPSDPQSIQPNLIRSHSLKSLVRKVSRALSSEP